MDSAFLNLVTGPSATFENIALLAEQNPGEVAKNFRKFGITEQEKAVQIAEICLKAGPTTAVKYFRQFGIRDEDERFRLAESLVTDKVLLVLNHFLEFEIQDESKKTKMVEICAQKNAGATTKSFANFGITDQTHLSHLAEFYCQRMPDHFRDFLKQSGITNQKEIARLVDLFAEKDPWETVHEFQEFGVTDPEDILRILEKCAKQNAAINPKYFEKIGITDPEIIFRFVEICAQVHAKATAQHFKKFQISKPSQIFRIATLCAQQDGSATAQYFANFGLTEPDQIFRIALLCAENGGAAASYFRNFGITEKDRVLKILEVCATQNGKWTAQWFQEFGITDQKEIVRIARLCGQKDGKMATYFHQFRIQEPQEIISIAELYAELDTSTTAQYITNFGLKDFQDALVRIAKICGKKDGGITASNIKSFQIADERTRAEIAKCCAIQDVRKTIIFLENFDIADPRLLWEIAEVCAQQNGLLTFANRSYFRISNPEDEWKLFLHALRQSPECFQLFSTIKNSDQTGSLPELFNLLDSENSENLQEQTWEEAVGLLKVYLEKKFSGLGFERLLNDEELLKIQDSYAKKNVLIWLGRALFILRESLSDEELKWVGETQILEGFFRFRQPFYRHYFTLMLTNLNADVQREFGQMKRSKLENYRWGKLLRIALAQLIVRQDRKEISSLLNVFDSKPFKDEKKFMVLIDMLRLLHDEKALKSQEKNLILSKLKSFRGNELVENVYALHSLLRLRKIAKLRKSDLSFVASMQNVFKKILNIQLNVADFYKTFGSCRNPDTLIQYAVKMKTLNDSEVMDCMSSYIHSVTDGTFFEKRNSLERNPHLTEVYKNREVLKEKWQQSIDPVPVIISAKNDVDKFSFLDWFKQKLLIDQHLDLASYPQLKKFLQAADVSQDFTEKHEGEEKARFEKQCIELCQGEKSWEDTQKALKEILIYLEKSVNPTPEFHHDVLGLINLSKDDQKHSLFIYDSEDPYDLLLCGTEVSGSCQRVDGDPVLNRGLLGYLVDGKIRLIAIKNAQGKIVARALLKILLDEEKKPVLFLERVYGPPGYKDSILVMAKKKAKALGIPLYSHGVENPQIFHTLVSLEGPAPFEYSEGAQTLAERGCYKVPYCCPVSVLLNS